MAPSFNGEEDQTAATAAAIKIQCLARRCQSVKRVLYVRKSKKLEQLRRMKATREKRKQIKMSNSVILIQAIVRGWQQRTKYQNDQPSKQQLTGIHLEIQKLHDKIAASEQERERAVQEAEIRIKETLEETRLEEERGLGTAEVEHIKISARLDESDKVLAFLRKERQRLLALVQTHKSRCERVVQQEHVLVQGSTEEVRSRMAELENYMLLLESNRATLARNKEMYEQQLSTYRKEIQKRHAYKKNEEEVGQIYRTAVERIVHLVQEQSNDDELVEDLYLLALECGDIDVGGHDADETTAFGDEYLDDLVDLGFPTDCKIEAI